MPVCAGPMHCGTGFQTCCAPPSPSCPSTRCPAFRLLCKQYSRRALLLQVLAHRVATKGRHTLARGQQQWSQCTEPVVRLPLPCPVLLLRVCPRCSCRSTLPAVRQGVADPGFHHARVPPPLRRALSQRSQRQHAVEGPVSTPSSQGSDNRQAHSGSQRARQVACCCCCWRSDSDCSLPAAATPPAPTPPPGPRRHRRRPLRPPGSHHSCCLRCRHHINARGSRPHHGVHGPWQALQRRLLAVHTPASPQRPRWRQGHQPPPAQQVQDQVRVRMPSLLGR